MASGSGPQHMQVDTAGGVSANAALNYVVTAHKSTAVIKSCVGAFTSPLDLNLVVAKSTRIEVHTSTQNGVETVLDVPIYGRISTIELFRPKTLDHDLLFVLLERFKFCILEFNSTTRELDTRASGDVRDNVGRQCDNGQLAVIDPECRCICLQLYDGMLKVIPLDDGGRVSEAFNTRLEELSVIDAAMMAGRDRPTVVILYEDSRGARHIKAYEVLMKEKDVVEVSAFSQQNLDNGAGLLVPVPAPLGGVMVLGENVVTYVGPGKTLPRSASLRPCVVKAWGRVDSDGSRVLMSDSQGLLYLLVLAHEGGQVAGIKVELVGRTSGASSISYLDAGVVFVGSRQGDSQLIRLHAQPPDATNPNSYVQVLATWPNLGPMIDFAVLDLDRQGQGQMVCCSGALSDGSLRVVRNGVGINEQATVELQGIRGVWSLRATWMDLHHKYLVLAFVGETRVLAINQEDELDEAELGGFDCAALTLWCGNMAADQLVQVVPGSVRAVDCHSGALITQWQPPAGSSLMSVAAGSPTQVVVACGGGALHLLQVSEGGITCTQTLDVGAEVACVDITPLGSDNLRAEWMAVGTWGMAVQLYRLSAEGIAQLVTTQALEGEVIPRSIMLWSFESRPHLLVGLGDGQLHHWKMSAETGVLSERKKLVLGSKPVLLRPFRGGGVTTATAGSGAAAEGAGAVGGVFAACDRPAVIYSHNHKIMYANLNENEVSHMAPFNSASFPDSLAIAKEGALTIGTVDAIQRLHIRSLPLHEQPRRIALQEETHSLGVVSVTNMGMEDETNVVRIYEHVGGVLEARASLALGLDEMGASITSCRLGETDPTPYYVVGTAFVIAAESEPTKGRLLVLRYLEGKLSLVAEREVKGAPYEVLPFHGGRLLNTCNSKVQVHRWVVREDGTKELQLECSATGQVTSLYLAARGDHVLMGDLTRSMSLYLYKQEEGVLELRAQDYASNWCTAVAMLDDDTYLAAENSYNLIVVRKNAEAANDEERSRLELVGEYHLGEFVNRIRPGSLVMRLPDSELAQVATWLFCTIDGTIGLLASMTPTMFELLNRLQEALRKVVRGVGGFSHAEFRSFRNERKVTPARGFIDGDLIELFLDLRPEELTKVMEFLGSGTSQDEVTRLVEELARLH